MMGEMKYGVSNLLLIHHRTCPREKWFGSYVQLKRDECGLDIGQRGTEKNHPHLTITRKNLGRGKKLF